MKFPKVTTEDMLLQSANDILTVLQTPPPSLIPKLHYSNDVHNAIDQLARLLHCAVQRTKPSSHKLPSPHHPCAPAPSLLRVQPVSLPRVPQLHRPFTASALVLLVVSPTPLLQRLLTFHNLSLIILLILPSLICPISNITLVITSLHNKFLILP